MNYAVQISNLTKQFRQSRDLIELLKNPFKKEALITALDGVSLTIAEREIFALLGPNGAGKTTLIKLICGLILPTRGRIDIMGFDATREAYRTKLLLGLLIPEERSFYWRLTARENLEFYATLYNLSKKEAKKRIEELMHFLDMSELDRRYQECSTGMKQKLAIARSILNFPRIVLMDEPTRSLDPGAAARFRAFIKKKLVKEKGCTVIMATHQTDEAEEIADRIGIIDKGRIVAGGSLDELRSKINEENASLKEIFIKTIS